MRSRRDRRPEGVRGRSFCMCETERTGTRTSVNEIVVIRVQSAAVARRRRARRDRATRQYACQAAWFEAGADGPGHYGRQCPSSGGWFYGARSTAPYCRPASELALGATALGGRVELKCPGRNNVDLEGHAAMPAPCRSTRRSFGVIDGVVVWKLDRLVRRAGEFEGELGIPGLDGKEAPMAPATSRARLRKQVLDLVASKRMKVREACRQLGISKSRYYELRGRYRRYGDAGLLPKPRPPERIDRRLSAPLVDQIIAYAINHPTEGPRTIAAALALARYGGWRVSHGGVYNVLHRAGLHRASARLAAAEALAASEGGPITERVLRELRALEVAHRHIGSDVLGEQVFLDTMYVGKLKGVGKI